MLGGRFLLGLVVFSVMAEIGLKSLISRQTEESF